MDPMWVLVKVAGALGVLAIGTVFLMAWMDNWRRVHAGAGWLLATGWCMFAVILITSAAGK